MLQPVIDIEVFSEGVGEKMKFKREEWSDRKIYYKVNVIGHFCNILMQIALYTFAEFCNLGNIIGQNRKL